MANSERRYGTVTIDGLKIFAHHGVLPQETLVGNVFEVSVRLKYDASLAMTTDRLEHALDYSDVIDTIKAQMKISSKLLENVTLRIAEAIQKRFDSVVSGSVSVYKIKPPIQGEMNRVGFTYNW